MDCSIMNVLYSSDDNYAQHMGASIRSLLEVNKDFDNIDIYIVDNQISMDNKSKLEQIAKEFEGTKIIWIPFTKYEEKLKLNMQWKISISAYGRLFIDEMLPKEVKRVLYLDCDTIVCDSLKELWQTNLKGNIVGGVQDTVGKRAKEKLGISDVDKYFNSGVLLVDLEAWRKKKIGEKCLGLIDKYEGAVYHHDQGVLNSVLKEEKYILPMRYNTITVHYFFNMNQIRKYYHENASFYSETEIAEAKEKPAILHFTPSFTSRPWIKGCKHPWREKYWNALRKTCWKNEKLQKNTTKWYIRLIEWRYRVLPY